MGQINFDIKEVGEIIATARKEKQISGIKFSKMLGKSAGYMHMVENGLVNIPILTLIKICEILSIDPKEFFD